MTKISLLANQVSIVLSQNGSIMFYEVFGMEITVSSILFSILVVVITFFILHFVKTNLIKKVSYENENEAHVGSFVGMIFNVLQYVIVIIAIIIILRINGFNVTSLIAGLGIIATIIGLSLQDTLKDVFAGINIYNNNFYKVGDVVIYNNERCEVKYFSARITKFRSLFTNSTYTVCNSCINSIEKVKDVQLLNLNFDISDDQKIIDKCFLNAVKKLEKDDEFWDIHYIGFTFFNQNGGSYTLMYKTNPKNIFASAKANRYVYDELAKAHISPNTDYAIKVKRDTWDL